MNTTQIRSDDKRHWIETGRLGERLGLMRTASNLKTVYLNAPIEVAELRVELATALELGAAKPQLLLRFGSAPPMPRSMRRNLEDVLV